jgi:hypothetical protein
MACSTLDSLFSWAAAQPTGNRITVQCDISTNESASAVSVCPNLVTYAGGFLLYTPSTHRGREVIPASFSNNMTQYFSCPPYSLPGEFDNFPFNPHNVGNLKVSIIDTDGNYTVSVNYPTQQSFSPQCGNAIIYGTLADGGVITMSLCNMSSVRPPSEVRIFRSCFICLEYMNEF